ncbi:MAG: hypothetical protein HW378_1139, partial [Anaerolineales bacterium]|nr:hypothetical protein [Anaerolineales bacterium]
EKVLMTVATCIECPDAPCMRACPQSVNIRDALKFLIETHPTAARYKALDMVARLDRDCGKGCE